VQDGFRHDPQTGDKEVDARIRDNWRGWSTEPDECDHEGELTFAEMEGLALSSVVTDGDTFCLPLNTNRLQWREAHRCRTPSRTTRNVVNGVLLDDNAKRKQYWFTKENLSPMQAVSRVGDIEPIDARDSEGRRQVLHLYMPTRFSQRRGITFLAPCSDTVGQHDDVQFATLVKAQAAALVAIMHNRGEHWEPTKKVDTNGIVVEDSPTGSRSIAGYSAGLEFFSEVDEKLEAFSPSIPSPEFFPHTMLLLTFIAINLDLPVHVLLLDPSRTNFSGWRGAIDQARIRFRQIQAWMVSKFHRPVYQWWLRRLIARDSALQAAAEKLGPRIFDHRWNPPQFAYVEPLTDITADDMEASRCLNSRRRIQAAHGRDLTEVHDEIIEDNAGLIRRAIVAAEALNNEFKEARVDWREVVSIPMVDKATAAIQLATQAQANEAAAPSGNPGGKS
jgi:lambda family phage portal protein